MQVKPEGNALTVAQTAFTSHGLGWHRFVPGSVNLKGENIIRH